MTHTRRWQCTALFSILSAVAPGQALAADTDPTEKFKEGTLTVESADRDTFHVTARSTAAFEDVADQLLNILPKDATVTLLTNEDRLAIATYSLENPALDRILANTSQWCPPLSAKTREAMAFSTLLPLVQQVLQAAKVDKSIAFSNASVPDSFLLDLVAAKGQARIRYSDGMTERALSGSIASTFVQGLASAEACRQTLASGGDVKGKQRATELTTELGALTTRLATADATTKRPLLLTVVRGEIALGLLKGASVLNINVAAKGGASLRTSSWWRSDRLYAAGGVVVTYSLVAENGARKTGALSSETGYMRVPLN